MSVLPFHDKDLSQLPAPQVLETLDYEALLTERESNLNALQPLLLDNNGQPAIKAAELIRSETESYWKVPFNEDAGLYYLDLESDPATRILQADTYRELLLRNRVNQAALATMPAFATGSDLDHIGVRYGAHRLTITAGGDNPAVMEADSAYRKRILLALEGYARGGSQGWYLFNTLSASGEVKDASVVSPSPCEIVITVLGHEGNGTASEALLEQVREHIESRHTRVLGDRVTIQSAGIIEYALNADILMYPGPSADTVLNQIQTAWAAYRAQSERIGHWISVSGVNAALHQPGVYRVVVNQPELPLVINSDQAPYCTGLSLQESTA